GSPRPAAAECARWARPGWPAARRARRFEAPPPPPAWSGPGIRLHGERRGDSVLGRARAAGVGAVLSPRELAVARIVCDGCTYKAVAKRLGIAPATARHHLRRVGVKLRVTTKSELIRVLDDDGELA
ncbi:helix-turn-helix domain-containing protein, partial [Burkholderia cenocepacia]|uniref:helix-turn-helix domain-containing protein n=1 Tax=Burkholderia cenocepacia TaxID=95486 RepID=UPI00406BF942